MVTNNILKAHEDKFIKEQTEIDELIASRKLNMLSIRNLAEDGIKQQQTIDELLTLLDKFYPCDEDGNGNFEYNEGSEYLGELVESTLSKYANKIRGSNDCK